jgi:stearoyl-CoA desaturase (delta-9 desaturase)
MTRSSRVSPYLRSCARAASLLAAHLCVASALARGVAWSDGLLCFALYVHGALVASVGLHRFFAHRTFEASPRFARFLALNACTTFTDPLEFAGKHRLHHRFADRPGDVHGPRLGLWRSWLGSLIDHGYSDEQILQQTKDLQREMPYLVALHRRRFIVTGCLSAVFLALGGFSTFAVGFLASRLLMLHVASLLNYACHRWGARPFVTSDDSRNLGWLAVLSFGEGWHNTHHRFPGSARTGILPGHFDPAYGVITLLARLGWVHDVRCADPGRALAEASSKPRATMPHCADVVDPPCSTSPPLLCASAAAEVSG